MAHARQTWLKSEVRHFFVISREDPDVSDLEDPGDILLVDCQHGYRALMQKMVIAYRILLAARSAWPYDKNIVIHKSKRQYYIYKFIIQNDSLNTLLYILYNII